jgi:hypothetical protein
MHPVTHDDLAQLVGEQPSPCISTFLPTHRRYPDSQLDAVAWRGLVDRAEAALRRDHPGAQVRLLIKPFRELERDPVFWTHRLEGLAAFGSPGGFETFDLQRPVPALAVVAESFHVKPLLRVVQSADRFHVLCLQRDAVELFEGNRDYLDPIDPPGVPLTAEAALDDEITSKRPQPVGAEDKPTHRNPPPKQAADRNDVQFSVEQFFRAVDRAVLERVSRPSRLPLVLVALPEHQSLFRKLTQNPQLLEPGVSRGRGELSPSELLEQAWQCVQPRYLERLARITDDFHVAKDRRMASDNLEEVSQAVSRDRVGVLLVDAEHKVPGRLDLQSGRAVRTDDEDSPADDLLDDLAERVWSTDGSVIVVPSERMPAPTGLAAIYRF